MESRWNMEFSEETSLFISTLETNVNTPRDSTCWMQKSQILHNRTIFPDSFVIGRSKSAGITALGRGNYLIPHGVRFRRGGFNEHVRNYND